MGTYRRLSFEERIEIYSYLRQGHSLRAIAAALKRHPATVSRELKRCLCTRGSYRPEPAQKDAATARRRKSRQFRSEPRRRYVIAGLRRGWSPEQIAGRLKREASPLYVCHETIYRWIYSREGRDRNLHLLLPRHKKQRGRRYARRPRRGIPNATPIAARPQDVLSRRTFGHWEGDLIFIGRTRCGAATALLERKSRYLLLLHNRVIYSENVIANIRNRMRCFPMSWRATLTFDRGKEFSSHQNLHAAGIRTYFCNPHSPWQKGAVENMNGRLRRYLPKGIMPKRFDQQFLDKLARNLNHTPRKCLGYQTPKEAFAANLPGNRCDGS